MRITLLITALLLSALTHAETIQYRDDIKPKTYNDVWKRLYEKSMRIDYGVDQDRFDFYIKQNLGIAGFTITRKQADSLIATIEKYKEWNLKASAKGVTLEKEIAEVDATVGFWKVGNGDWYFSDGFKIKASFFSQTKDVHQLILVFPKLQDKENPYADEKPETLYLSYKTAMQLKSALEPESVKKFLKEHKKQAAIEAEFN